MSATWPTPTIHLVGEQYGQRTACGLRVLSGLHVTRQHETITCPDCERVDTDHLSKEEADSVRAHYARQARRRRALAVFQAALPAFLGVLMVWGVWQGDWSQATFWGLALAWCHAHPLTDTHAQEG